MRSLQITSNTADEPPKRLNEAEELQTSFDAVEELLNTSTNADEPPKRLNEAESFQTSSMRLRGFQIDAT